MKRRLGFLGTAALLGVLGAGSIRGLRGQEGVPEPGGSASRGEPDPELTARTAAGDGEIDATGPRGRVGGRKNLVAKKSAATESRLSPAHAALHWLGSRQNVDGSWGSGYENVSGEIWTTAGATSLSVLAFFSMGWTAASRDRWKDSAPGEAVSKAEGWLRGYLPGTDREAALVALALCESAGYSGEEEAKETAHEAIGRLLELQRQDGSWEDPHDTVWAAMALKSAAISGLEVPEGSSDRMSAWLGRRLECGGGDAEAFASLMWHRSPQDPALRRIVYDSARNLPDAENPDFARCYFGSLAACHYGAGGYRNGPDRHWVNGLRRALAMTAQAGGGWSGDIATTGAVVRNALGSMSLVRFTRSSSSIDGPPVDLPPLQDEAVAEVGTGMGDDAPLDGVQDSGSDLLMGDSAPVQPASETE